MLNVYVCYEERGQHAREPRTGAYRTTRVRVLELCDREADRREYKVEETVGFYTLRSERFVCAGYFDLRGGHAERARELARAWRAEARANDERRRAAGEFLISID